MGFAFTILFVIYGGGYYLIRYLIESAKEEAFEKKMEARMREEYEHKKPEREKMEAEGKLKEALLDYMDRISNGED